MMPMKRKTVGVLIGLFFCVLSAATYAHSYVATQGSPSYWGDSYYGCGTANEPGCTFTTTPDLVTKAQLQSYVQGMHSAFNFKFNGLLVSCGGAYLIGAGYNWTDFDGGVYADVTYRHDCSMGAQSWSIDEDAHAELRIVGNSCPEFDHEPDASPGMRCKHINFAPNPPSITGPSSVFTHSFVDFTGSTTDPNGDSPLTYTWLVIDLATGFPVLQPSQVHTKTFGSDTFTVELKKNGSYKIYLTVNDPSGAASTTAEYAVQTINSPPHALALLSSFSTYLGDPISFKGSNSSDPDGDPITFEWDFNDFGSSTLADPSHTYTELPKQATGVFTVILTVSDGKLASSDFLDVAIIPKNKPPVGVLIAPASARVGIDAMFNAASSFDPDTALYGDEVTKVLWDFDVAGASSSSIKEGFFSTLHTVNYKYSTPGTYHVSLWVYDSHGAESLRQDAWITVTPNQQPTAVISSDANNPYEKVQVSFDASTSADADGDALHYTFNFGDGTVLTTDTATASHPFTLTLSPTEIANLINAGTGISQTFNVSVTVSDGFVTTVSSPVSISVRKAYTCDAGTENVGVDTVGNPVSTAGGNKVEMQTDYVGAGPMPLEFVRIYNSIPPLPTELGYGWRHNYMRSIKVTGTTADVYRAEGAVIPFAQQKDGTWKAPGAVTTRLQKIAATGGWQYIDDDNTEETYDSQGRLLTIKSLAGHTLSLAYVNGKLNTVSDEYGRVLTLSYYADASARLHTVTDPASIVTTYEYTGNGNLWKVSYPNSTLREYLYEDATFTHALTGIKHETGKQYSFFEYDTFGQATRSYHAGLADDTHLQHIDANTSIVTDALGVAREYKSKVENGIRRTTNVQKCATCATIARSTTIDPATGYPDLITDYRGMVTDYDYDTRGLEIQRIEAKGTLLQRIVTIEWNSTYRLPECVIEPTRTIDFGYFTNGQLQFRTEIDTSSVTGSHTCADLAARTDIRKRTWTYTYFTTGIKKGLVQTIDGPRTDVNDISTYEYYNETESYKGSVKTITNALSQVTQFLEYDVHGRPQKIKDANGLITKLEYDLRGRLRFRREGTDAAGYEVTEYRYDNAGNLDKLILPNSAFLDYDYDDAHRLTDVRDQLGNHIHYSLDGMGNRTQVDSYDPQNVLKRTHANHYWPSNQLKDSDNAANPSVAVAPAVTKYMKPDDSEGYDANGNPTHVRDAEGRTTQTGYDAHNRLESVTDAKQGITQYSYYADHRVRTVTDPHGVVTTYTYDGLGNVKTIDSKDAGLTQFTKYDGAGNVTERIDARGKKTTYTYDALNRVDLVTYNDGKTADYLYDQGANGIGHLSFIFDDAGALSYTYDLHGRVKTKSQQMGGVVVGFPVTLKLEYTYDTVGQLQSIKYPSGKTVQYNYTNGVTTSMNLVGGPNLLTNMRYEPFGPLSQWTFGNGAAIIRSYDVDGMLRDYTLGTGTRTLDYTPNGNVWHVRDLSMPANDQTFGYDELNRITSYQGLGQSLGYGYDANGNRNSYTIGITQYAVTVEPASNRLNNIAGPAARSYGYDAVGNITGDGQHTYGYDDRGRYTSLDNGAVLYSINTLGQRVKKQVNNVVLPGDANGDGAINAGDRGATVNAILGTTVAGKPDCNRDGQVNILDLVCVNSLIQQGSPLRAVTYFAYDEAGQLRGVYDANGTAIQEIVWFGNQPVNVLNGSTVYNLYTDHLNTPRLIADQTNKTVWTWTSDPFGTTAANEDADGDGQRFSFNLRFPGQYYDYETGMHYNVNRTYDPAVGRYLESDPIGLSGGLNVSSYAYNQPLRYVDSMGLEVSAVYDMSEGILYVTDLDTGQTAKANAFSGNRYENDVRFTDRVGEGPLPLGSYDMLNHPSGKVHGKQWYDLDIQDGRRDDKDPWTGRGAFRLHQGTASDGCITVKDDKSPLGYHGESNRFFDPNNPNNHPNADAWDQIVTIMHGTTTTTVQDAFGRSRTYYGTLMVLP